MSSLPCPLSEEELVVTSILLNFADYHHNRDRHSPPDLLAELSGWGLHKRRSLSSLEPSLSPNGPAAENKGSYVGPVASSPVTPLSLPGSSAEDNAPVVAPQVKQPKGKSHKQWVEEQKRKIVSLSEDNAYLKKIAEQYKDFIQGALAKNKLYREAQLAGGKAMHCSGQRPNSNSDPVGATPTVDPAVLTIQGSTPAVDSQERARYQMTQPATTAWKGRSIGVREDLRLLDLNVAPADVADELHFQPQHSQYHEQVMQMRNLLVEDKAAKSAQARKRRLEIQREKNSMSSLLSSPHLMKISKLR